MNSQANNSTSHHSFVDPRMTFANLVCGQANHMAYAAAGHVSEEPGNPQYNPLFIYGGVGLGKTHLMHAIGNQLKEKKLSTTYMRAEVYFKDVVKAVRSNNFEGFREHYSAIDVLLLDDIQFFSGKERTQEEFYYLFNHCVENNKQIVISSDTMANDLSGIQKRLSSRFASGLAVAIAPPDLEMRIAILEKKAAAVGMTLSPDVANYIARLVKSNVRDLEGRLKKFMAYCRFSQKKPDLHAAKEALADEARSHARIITLENIQKIVCEHYKVSASALFSKKRDQKFAYPRQVAMFLAKELTQQSLPAIGDFFGGRAHTTVMHGHKKIKEEVDTTRESREEIQHLMHRLQD